jgi:hypothetical protein
MRSRWHARDMVDEDPTTAYQGALMRGFRFAHELGCTCGPAHLLVGVADGDGPGARALAGSGRSLRAVVTDAPGSLSEGAAYLSGQVQDAARALAQELGTPTAAEHLLIAVLDQATPQVRMALQLAGIDPSAARAAALTALGVDTDLPPVSMPALTPAGTLDRPPLPIADLDPRAWSALRWRQDHLPLHRLHGKSSWQGLSSVEYQAAWRLPTRLGLDDDQRYSLLSHHHSAVEKRMAAARPDLAPPRLDPDLVPRLVRGPAVSWLQTGTRRWRWRRRLRFLSFTIGWGTWFGNRWVDVRDRWFWLTTLRHYRRAPQR